MTSAVLRIIDADFNRAREALRVMEEYARFCLDDAALTEATKMLRHELVDAIPTSQADGKAARTEACGSPERGGAQGDGIRLIGARDIVGDVGSELETDAEYRRASAADVAIAAAKRATEALRSIEEYGKTIDTQFAKRVERIRYDAYEVERRLALTICARQRFGDVRLYVIITESLCRNDWFSTAEAVLAGGADCLQLREKELGDRELLERARRLSRLCRQWGKLLIVNDRPDIAAVAGADGVHLGQADPDVASARKALPASAMVGVSTHTLDQVERAIEQTPDYIAVGPIFESATKAQGYVVGPEMLSAAARRTSIPLAAIGGIDEKSVRRVVGAAPCCVCVCSAVIRRLDPTEATHSLRSVIDETWRARQHG